MTSDLQQDHGPVFLPILGKNPLCKNAMGQRVISTSDGGGASGDGDANGGGDASHGDGASRDDDASRDAGAHEPP